MTRNDTATTNVFGWGGRITFQNKESDNYCINYFCGAYSWQMMQFLMACQASHALTNFLVMENERKSKMRAEFAPTPFGGGAWRGSWARGSWSRSSMWSVWHIYHLILIFLLF